MQRACVYYGEEPCSAIYKSGSKKGQACINKAYYLTEKGVYCGVHSNRQSREALPKNPLAKKQKEERLDQDLVLLEKVAKENKERGCRGKVRIYKMRMRREVERFPGYLLVFPNFKHGNRKDGLGLPSLSPMKLGTINGEALNLENWWQFSKVYPFEADEQGSPSPLYFENRKRGFSDPIPHRHKYDRKILASHGNVNKPLYSLFGDKRYSYVQARYFYCHNYEVMAKKEESFYHLQDLLQQGYNLQICGYDGYEVKEDLYLHYLDESKPFGHELVLYTLLTTEEEEEYPWNRYKREHQDLY